MSQPNFSFARKLLAVVCSILLLLVLLVLSLAVPLQLTALDPAVWTQSIEKAGVYAKVLPLATGVVQQQFSQATGFPLTTQMVEPLVPRLFSKNWFDAQLKTNLESFFDFLNGKKSAFAGTVLLQEPKEKAVPALLAAFSLPADFAPALQKSLEHFPDQIEFGTDASTQAAVKQVRTVVQLFEQSVLVLGVFAIVLIIFIFRLVGNERFFFWVAVVGILAALTVWAVFWALPVLLNSFFSSIASSSEISIVQSVAVLVLAALTQKVFIAGALLFVAGALSAIVFYVHSKNRASIFSDSAIQK